MQTPKQLLPQLSLDKSFSVVAPLTLDPFDEDEDDFIPPKSFNAVRMVSLQTSPLTSPERPTPHASLSPSSSQSSTTSSGRAMLRSCSKRVTPMEGLGLLRRNMEVLRLSKDNRVLEHAMRTVRELMSCEFVNENHIMENGNLEIACNLLKAHQGVSCLMEEVCRFLAVICEWSYEAREIVIRLNGVESIRGVMEMHFELYASTVDAAMRVMGALCMQGSCVRVRIREERCLEWILVCVRQWRDVRSLLNSALICLGRALVNEEESKTYAVSLGLFQELVYTMHRFQEDSVVQKNVLRLLNVLISDSKENRIMSAVEGGVERVIHALKYFCGKTDVVLSAARASDYYCISSACRSCFIGANGVECLLEAVRETTKREREFGSISHRHAISYCIRTLARVTLHLQSRLLVSRAEHLTNILNATSQYETDDVVAEAVCKLLRNLTVEDNERTGFRGLFLKGRLSASALEQIVETSNRLLAAKISNVKIVENSCMSLLNICDQGKVHVVKKGFPGIAQVLQEVIEKHSEKRKVAKVAISLATQVR